MSVKYIELTDFQYLEPNFTGVCSNLTDENWRNQFGELAHFIIVNQYKATTFWGLAYIFEMVHFMVVLMKSDFESFWQIYDDGVKFNQLLMERIDDADKIIETNDTNGNCEFEAWIRTVVRPVIQEALDLSRSL